MGQYRFQFFVCVGRVSRIFVAERFISGATVQYCSTEDRHQIPGTAFHVTIHSLEFHAPQQKKVEHKIEIMNC